MPLTLWLALCLPALADGTVEGFVTDATGAPVAGAVLRAGDREVTVDADGAFSWALPAGNPAVEVVLPGAAPVALGAVPVVDDAVTELLISLVDGAPLVTIEAPTGGAAPVETDVVLIEVSGRVTDEEGAPVAGARVFVRGRDVEASTDADGRFVLPLPAGTHDLSVLRSGYATRTVSGVEVGADGAPPVEVTLIEAGVSLAAFEVKAPRVEGGTTSLLAERREASTVSDTLGAEQMSKAGDSDAAAALRRVTGITVVGGRYVYVRGLGDRYSATLLNGSTLPSPEPEKRVVPLDLFPTSVLEGVVIQKTFSPDKPAEFGGGVVQIRTRSVPDAPVFLLAASTGYRAATTFANGVTGDRGPTDALGFGEAFRALPDLIVRDASDLSIKPGGLFSEDGFSSDEIEAFGESFDNRWGLSETTLPPDVSAQLSVGNGWQLGDDLRVGALVGLSWSDAWNLQDATRNVYSATAEDIVLKRRTVYDQLSNRITLGGLATFGAKFGDEDEIANTFLLNRVSEYEALTWLADDPTGSDDSRSNRLGWVEQQLMFEQLAGHHRVAGTPFLVDWRYAYSQADRAEPDRREWTYSVTGDGEFLSQRGTWNELLYSDLRDRNHDAGLDLAYELGEGDRPGRVQVGGLAVERRRTSGIRRFSYEFRGTEGIDLSAPIEDVLTADNIGADSPDDPGYLAIEEVTSNSDDYTAVQHLRAGYALIDLPVIPRIRVATGARLETSLQNVSTFELFNPAQAPIEAELKTADLLPSANVAFGLGPKDENDRMLVRLGYGRTVSRPEFRELSQVPFTDFRTGALVYGNPDLQRALIDNVDLRWELYPSPAESLSVALFYKRFQDPIERITEISAISGLASTFDNAGAATNLGVELDGRLSFERVADALRDFFVAANGSVIRSRVDLSQSDGNDTSDSRPLQGQSPWVANLQLGYDNPESGVSVTVLYNAFGPRIVDVGQSGIPDTYELPVHRLDAVTLLPFAPGWQLRLRGSNLLDPAIVQRTGEQVAEETKDGWGASLGLQWRPTFEKRAGT